MKKKIFISALASFAIIMFSISGAKAQTQDAAVKYLMSLGYTFYQADLMQHPEHYGDSSGNISDEKGKQYLRLWGYSEKQINTYIKGNQDASALANGPENLNNTKLGKALAKARTDSAGYQTFRDISMNWPTGDNSYWIYKK